MAGMVDGLERRQGEGDLHFVTFSCFHRCGYLGDPAMRDLFEEALARMCHCYQFGVFGYVVMPEHVHLLLSEPEKDLLGVGLQALKISVSKRAKERPFWQARYYDFNVFTKKKRIEKLNYIHWNPVKRGLVGNPEDWLWSSYRYYETGVQGRVKISW
jgi:putative transposase